MKTKPTNGWKPKRIQDVPRDNYSTDQIRRIAEILEVTGQKDIADLTAKLNQEARLFFVWQSYDDAPRPAQIRKKLNNLNKNAEALKETLDGLDHSTRGHISRAWAQTENQLEHRTKTQTVPPKDIPTSTILDNTVTQIERLIPCIALASTLLELDKGGRKKKGARLLFILGLAKLYQVIVGARPTRRFNPYAQIGVSNHEPEYGPFRNFVVAALEPLGHYAVKGIDDDIRDALRNLPNMG